MMKRKVLSSALLLAGGFLLSTNVALANPQAKMLAENCAGCHGPQGSSVGPASPTIAGVEAETFIEIMQAYKAADRPSTIMTRIAKGYSEEEIKLMSGYFSQQKFVRHEQKTDSKKVASGKKLHKKFCEKCHEDNGYKDEDGSSVLAGQWKPYLEYSMADFMSGDRSMPKKMKKRLQKMIKAAGEESVTDVIEFYASQK
jgi:sulfide dehydrogenase cytochrome subunit